MSSGAVAEEACADGSFNADGSGDCDDVQNGYFGNTGGAHVSSGATAETACAEGTFSVNGTGACQTVQNGYYASNGSQTHSKSA